MLGLYWLRRSIVSSDKALMRAKLFFFVFCITTNPRAMNSPEIEFKPPPPTPSGLDAVGSVIGYSLSVAPIVLVYMYVGFVFDPCFVVYIVLFLVLQ